MFRITLTALLSATPLLAQICTYTGSTDPGNGGTSVGSELLAPGPPTTQSAYYRKQILIPAAAFANVPHLIRDISVAVKVGWRSMRVPRLVVRMGHTTRSSLDVAFAVNITSPLQDVLVADDYVLFQGVGPAWVPIGLQQPFQYSPALGNLLIETVQVGGEEFGLGGHFSYMALSSFGEQRTSSWSTTLPSLSSGVGTVPAMRICVDYAGMLLLGESCPSSTATSPLLGLTGTPSLGSRSTIWLS
ncbi:MAG: hypothetical protein KDC98_04775, partial [Planctomycetes bacterium]|nr:hypothetical protein [Planctomycetota bacterium]